MFKEKFVLAVKHNGRVLREQGDTVFLPFGCEYSLHFKNLNSVRALVRVSIDGADATEGTSLICPANGSIDLERFIKNGNFSAGQRFKFIERSAKIEAGPRGIKAEDGLIRVEFEFEQLPRKIERAAFVNSIVHHNDVYWKKLGGSYSTTASLDSYDGEREVKTSSGIVNTSNASYSSTASSPLRSMPDRIPKGLEANAGNQVLSAPGITVGGSVSDQQFSVGAWFPTDGQKHVMIMKVLGETETNQPITKPITVSAKQECPTCGTKNKFGTKFCRECGTGLVIS